MAAMLAGQIFIEKTVMFHEKQLAETGETRFVSFCRVGSGLTIEERQKLHDQLAPYAIPAGDTSSVRDCSQVNFQNLEMASLERPWHLFGLA